MALEVGSGWKKDIGFLFLHFNRMSFLGCIVVFCHVHSISSGIMMIRNERVMVLAYLRLIWNGSRSSCFPSAAYSMFPFSLAHAKSFGRKSLDV